MTTPKYDPADPGDYPEEGTPVRTDWIYDGQVDLDEHPAAGEDAY